MSNVDQRLAAYRDRMRNLDAEKRARSEDSEELADSLGASGTAPLFERAA